MNEDNFLRSLKARGLVGVRLFVSDKCLGLVESLAEFYPTASWQRCAVHFYRNVWTAVPTSKVREVAAMLKAIALSNIAILDQFKMSSDFAGSCLTKNIVNSGAGSLTLQKFRSN